MSDRRKIIITTGDISDFDGFLALSLYKNSGADIVAFIMNYPAYFDNNEDEELPFNIELYNTLKKAKTTREEAEEAEASLSSSG